MFRICGIAYAPDHILAMLNPGSSQRCADRSGANYSDTHEYLLVLHEDQPSVFQRSINNETPKNEPSPPRGDVACCDKGCNPPYHLGLNQQGRVTLIRHDD